MKRFIVTPLSSEFVTNAFLHLSNLHLHHYARFRPSNRRLHHYSRLCCRLTARNNLSRLTARNNLSRLMARNSLSPREQSAKKVPASTTDPAVKLLSLHVHAMTVCRVQLLSRVQMICRS
jgi:hypothetical protein